MTYTGTTSGGVLADGGTAQSDLSFALDNIFNHPNVGPFISKQLIQRLVTSNPSPAYVQRVASVFNNNGSGMRGNLKDVVQAILLDPEARMGQWQNPDTFGKLREPLLTLTHFWRAMDAHALCGTEFRRRHNSDGTTTTFEIRQPAVSLRRLHTAVRIQRYQWGVGVGQASMDAPTVFNFFKPGFMPPGEMTTRNLLGPEFQMPPTA